MDSARMEIRLKEMFRRFLDECVEPRRYAGTVYDEVDWTKVEDIIRANFIDLMAEESSERPEPSAEIRLRELQTDLKIYRQYVWERESPPDRIVVGGTCVLQCGKCTRTHIEARLRHGLCLDCLGEDHGAIWISSNEFSPAFLERIQEHEPERWNVPESDRGRGSGFGFVRFMEADILKLDHVE